MKRIALMIGALTLCATTVFAEQTKETEKVEFKRLWSMQLQAGASYTLGEAGFGKLVSPAAALSAGYQFSPVWGIRFGLSGWQSKGAWVSPEAVYQYKYLQGNVEATLDLANLFGRFNARRTVNPYLFAGVGVNGAFDNDEANALKDKGYDLGLVWSGSKVLPVGRMGVGVNFRLSDCVLLGIEANANMLSDKYNSKKAKNLDWQFNALAGLTIRFGKNYKKTAVSAPAYVPAAETTPAQPKEEPKAVEPVSEKTQPVSVKQTAAAEMRQDVFFAIGQVAIAPSESDKIAALTSYLKANPDAKVSIIGYADSKTGSHAVNERISQRRAESVAMALQQNGIDASRIDVQYKGDREQPFEQVEQNRVSICVAR